MSTELAKTMYQESGSTDALRRKIIAMCAAMGRKPEDVFGDVDALVCRVVELLAAELDRLMVPDDIQAVVDFYRSDLGRRLVAIVPALSEAGERAMSTALAEVERR